MKGNDVALIDAKQILVLFPKIDQGHQVKGSREAPYRLLGDVPLRHSFDLSISFGKERHQFVCIR